MFLRQCEKLPVLGHENPKRMVNVCVDGCNLVRSMSGIARLIHNTIHQFSEVKIEVSLVAPDSLHSDFRKLLSRPHVTVSHDYLSGISGYI